MGKVILFYWDKTDGNAQSRESHVALSIPSFEGQTFGPDQRLFSYISAHKGDDPAPHEAAATVSDSDDSPSKQLPALVWKTYDEDVAALGEPTDPVELDLNTNFIRGDVEMLASEQFAWVEPSKDCTDTDCAGKLNGCLLLLFLIQVGGVRQQLNFEALASGLGEELRGELATQFYNGSGGKDSLMAAVQFANHLVSPENLLALCRMAHSGVRYRFPLRDVFYPERRSDRAFRPGPSF